MSAAVALRLFCWLLLVLVLLLVWLLLVVVVVVIVAVVVVAVCCVFRLRFDVVCVVYESNLCYCLMLCVVCMC